ncbi:MAG: hypothetical protein V7727_20845 [Sneathiella sp.]
MGKENALKKELQADVLINLKKGNLVGFGFSTPRKMDDDPQEIPLKVWENNIVWDNNRIEGRGLVVEDVRIVSRQTILIAKRQTVPVPYEITSKGRPSRREEILEAFTDLNNKGEIDYSGPMRSVVPLIQNWLFIHPIYSKQGDQGLGSQVIIRTISSAFKEKKSKV